jgi:hypothetical protein
MAKAIHVTNPFSKEIDSIFDFEKGESVLDAAAKLYGEGNTDFELPTICIVGDKPLLREEWGSYVPKDSEIVSFIAVTGANILVYIVISIVVAVAVSLIFTVTPPKIGAVPEPDPVFTLRGQTNKIKLGDPIEDHYGRVRIFPSYAAISYNKYIDNEQYLYSLFCLGQGEFEIEDILIEDTNINNFDDAEYVIYEPGQTVDLFRDNVETSNEVGGIEMFGSNEPQYPTDGWVGPFSASGALTSSDILEVDITIPSGLGFSNDDGGLSNRTVEVLFQYRQIDQNGDPLGSWVTLNSFSKTLRTVTPQRYTLTKVVPSGRYEVRGRRTNTKDTNFRANNTIQWESLRAFLPNVGNYGDVTLLALRARASNSLNDSARSQVNLFATRKLPIWNGVSWSNPTATRSAVWAMANIFRSIYGGNITDNKFFDLEDFVLKDQQLTTEGRNFDWTFDTRSTVWEDAALICRAVRGRPLLRGSIITIALEREKTIPTAVFGPNNIIQGSLEWDIKIYNQNEYDGIEAEYVNPITWKQEVIECALPDSNADFLEPMKFPGITDRDIAYREGMYEESKRRYNRENVTFSTGLEGHIPTWGDLILVQHDLPKWGQGGRLLAFQGLVLQLDSEVTFTAGQVHQVVLKDKTGAASGPHIVTEVVGNSYEVELQSSIDLSAFDFSSTHERPIFAFGVQNLEGKLLTVVDVSTDGEEEISITGSNYDQRAFYYDTLSPAPPAPPPSVIDSWSLPRVTGLGYSLNNDASQVTILWNSIRSARLFVVQWSDNLTTYTDTIEVTDNTVTLDVPYTPMYIRVAAVTDLGQGPWAGTTLSQSDTEAATPVLPSNVNVVPGYGSLQVYWDTQAGADFYEISAKGFSGQAPTVDETSEIANYLLAGLGDNDILYFRVRAVKTLTTGIILYSAWSPEVSGTTLAVVGGNFYGPTAPLDPGAVGTLWFDTDDGNRMYRWSGTAWVDVQKVLEADDFGLDIRPIQIVSVLPTLPDGDYPVGAQVTLSTDDYRLYRNNAGTWDYSVNTEQIDTSAITTIKIANDAITDIKIIDGAVVAGKIADDAVIADNILDGAIVAGKLGVNAVDSGNIAADAVVAGKIADDAVVADNILDGAIVAGKLGNNAVTAGSIATDAVTADKILANSVTATKIDTDAVTANKIEANAVTAVKIDTNAVTANKIEANAVTAVKIDTDAVTADKILANSVTATKIDTDAVTADKIAANAVTTNKLLVSGRGAALNADPGCQDSSAWVKYPNSLSNATFTTITDGLVGNNVIRGSNRAWYNGADRLPFDPNKTYRIRGVARRSSATANGTCYIGVALFDSNGTNINGAGTQWFYAGDSSFVPGTDFTLRSGEFGFDTAKTFPANARTMAPLIILSYNGTIGYMEAQDLRIEEKINGELIVDGAITADKIEANAVTADKILANSVTADKILANSVTADKILANSITASKLTLGGTTGNIVGTSNLTDYPYWTLVQGTNLTFQNPSNPVAWNSTKVAKLGDSANVIVVNGQTFEVEPGDVISARYKAYINSGTAGTVYMDVMYSQNEDFTGTLSYGYFSNGSIPYNVLTTVEGKAAPVPSGYRFAKIRMVKLNNGPLRAYFGDTYFKKAIDTRLIVDGAIEASQISAGAITADAVGTNEIIANLANISQAVIDDLSVGSISAGDITTGTIDSAVFNLSGNGGVIKSDNFVAGSTGLQILGNGTAEFSDVNIRGNAVVEGKIQNSELIIDNDVYLYKSDALDKPAVPQVSQANSSNGTSIVSAPLYFYGRKATGSSTSNRVLGDNPTFQFNAYFAYYDNSKLSGKIEIRVNNGSWVNWKNMDLQNDWKLEDNYEQFYVLNIGSAVAVSSTGNVGFRIRASGTNNISGSINYYSKYRLGISVNNWT